MNKVLIDTSVWSMALRRNKPNEKNAQIAEELATLIRAYRVVIIGPVRQELLSGISNQTVFENLKNSFYHFLCGKTVHLQNEKIGLMMNFGYVYIMTNKNKTTLYIGVLINQKNPEWKELVNERGFIRDRG